MSTKLDNKDKKEFHFSTLKWIVVVLFVAAGIVANMYYANTFSTGYRVLAWCVLAIIIVFIALQTQQGHAGWLFAKDARVEMRKVTWPSRQETLQTAMVVVGIVLITALVLWAMDSFLVWAVGMLAGNGVG